MRFYQAHINAGSRPFTCVDALILNYLGFKLLAHFLINNLH